ncbi:hypothetical protein Nepgr_023716 [Nepenthes gracilis]|uniref:Uncharacterized protein n=1 Tax=Nepenthes gracilis TaxID=150966 RepID=A0AAD3T1G5_NEPGR|nr:hypothetical protein Nepgr_023716 [Nepenthes gracilis]
MDIANNSDKIPPQPTRATASIFLHQRLRTDQREIGIKKPEAQGHHLLDSQQSKYAPWIGKHHISQSIFSTGKEPWHHITQLLLKSTQQHQQWWSKNSIQLLNAEPQLHPNLSDGLRPHSSSASALNNQHQSTTNFQFQQLPITTPSGRHLLKPAIHHAMKAIRNSMQKSDAPDGTLTRRHPLLLHSVPPPSAPSSATSSPLLGAVSSGLAGPGRASCLSVAVEVPPQAESASY